jgi:hypothetical protein
MSTILSRYYFYKTIADTETQAGPGGREFRPVRGRNFGTQLILEVERQFRRKGSWRHVVGSTEGGNEIV